MMLTAPRTPTTPTRYARSLRRAALLTCLLCTVVASASRKPKKTPEDLRNDYLDKVAATWTDPPLAHTTGSLWSPNGVLNEPGLDYKAHTLHDDVTIAVSVQTTAAQSGSVNNARDFTTTSALTGIFGKSPGATNPLFAANSSSALKGSGQTASNTTFSTNLTGEVIAVLPNGSLVIEAHRQIFLNNQHEEVIVRGIARPGDIDPTNTVASTSLSSLEIELRGKGIISDSTRPLNPVTRALLRIFNF